jgi:hypothetical protein
MSNQLTKKNNQFKWIPLELLDVVHADAQRGLDERNVRRIVQDFDPDLFGVVTVAEMNGTGTHHIIDGQHRVEALRRLGWADQTVPCVVRNSHDKADVARMFDGINTARKPQYIDRFRVRVTAGFPLETAVNEIVERHGYTVKLGSNTEARAFSAASAAVQVAERYGLKVLDDTLGVLVEAWGHSRDAVHQCVVAGVGAAVYAGVDVARLADRLESKVTPGQLVGKARARKEYDGGTIAHNVAEVALSIYNTGLRSGRVELS